jgi:hypothetical protein
MRTTAMRTTAHVPFLLTFNATALSLLHSTPSADIQRHRPLLAAQYAEANRHRATTLRELAERFPKTVHLPLGAEHGWFARLEGPR